MNGQRSMLLRLVQQRFGPPPPQVRTRIEEATRADLEAWTDRILTAPTLADLLDPASSPRD
ncbi:MAG: DUF4351 domain-containing protein [Polyangiaceae bacterium]